LIIEPNLTVEYLRTCDLRSLIKLAGKGSIEVHEPKDLNNLGNTTQTGGGGGATIYKTTINNNTLALKVFQPNYNSTVTLEDQKKCFRREIALTRYFHLYLIQID
jgi:hypothetical protein